jgi:carotenoid cleavage oxygenase
MDNHYLQGNFAPVHDELTVTDLPVTGHLPPELDGRFVRNGPNPVTAPDPTRYHWFTGTGMVHGIRLQDGQARWYRNRFVRSAEVAAALGEPARPGPVFADMDVAANTNVTTIGGRTFALVEGGGRPYELSDGLDTIGPSDFDGTLPGAFTAHPKFDPFTGETHAVAYWWGWGDRVQHVVLDRAGRTISSRFVPTTGSPMLHDMSITERWVVVYDLPVAFDGDAALAGDPFPYHWTPGYPARLGLVPRAGGPVRWIDVEPCYVFHPLNAYDDLDEVVLDVVRWPKMFDGPGDGPSGNGQGSLWRWRVDPHTGKAIEEQLDDHAEEFPRIDERLTGRRHRYGYGAVTLPRSHFGIVKHDLERDSHEVLDLGLGAGLNEAVFVPSADGRAEDDGWLLSIVYRPERDASDLVVVDARHPAAGPVARVHLPTRVPFGFHGNWLPASGSVDQSAESMSETENPTATSDPVRMPSTS